MPMSSPLIKPHSSKPGPNLSARAASCAIRPFIARVLADLVTWAVRGRVGRSGCALWRSGNGRQHRIPDLASPGSGLHLRYGCIDRRIDQLKGNWAIQLICIWQPFDLPRLWPFPCGTTSPHQTFTLAERRSSIDKARMAIYRPFAAMCQSPVVSKPVGAAHVHNVPLVSITPNQPEKARRQRRRGRTVP